MEHFPFQLPVSAVSLFDQQVKVKAIKLFDTIQWLVIAFFTETISKRQSGTLCSLAKGA